MTLSNKRRLLILNGYLSCDNYQYGNADLVDVETLNEIEECVSELNADFVLLGSDMNTDLNRNNAYSNLLADMFERHGLHFGWLHDNSHPTYTYVSSDHRSRSTIDHFVADSEINKEIDNVYVKISAVNPLCHRPIHLSLNMNINTIPVKTGQFHAQIISWGRVSNQHHEIYRQ